MVGVILLLGVPCDGQGKTISNLFINRGSANYVGLFGYVGGSVKNVGLKNPVVTGTGNVGGLVGYNNLGIITACYAGGKNYDNLVGDQDGTVTNSYHQLASGGTEDATSKFEATLKAPTAYGTSPSIYASWDVDGTAGGEDPWDFGSGSQYPVLNIDFNEDGNSADDVTRQRN